MYKKEEKTQSVRLILEDILEAHPSARNDDNILYCFYLNAMGYSKNISVWEMTLLIKQEDISPIETITRVKRKIRQHRPDLFISSEVEAPF